MQQLNSPFGNVFIGDDCLDKLSSVLLQEFSDYKKFILVDQNSLEYCMPKLIASVPELAKAEVLEIESGEENKNISICEQLWLALAEINATRKSLLINLGGGVITDMGAFIATVYKRGIPFINIPTTLLSQVDASIGGKSGIDLGAYKNMIGTFSKTSAVFIYPEFLNTLPAEQIRSGFAEIIKHGLIVDLDYYRELNSINNDSMVEWEKIILRSLQIKNGIVTEDPYEKGPRKKLNFGHTIAHGIEGYFLSLGKPVLHGDAVAAGMIMEAFLSVKIAGLDEAQFNDITNMIDKRYKRFSLNANAIKEILFLMRNDKKNASSDINFSLLRSIGNCEYDHTASEAAIMEALYNYSN